MAQVAINGGISAAPWTSAGIHYTGLKNVTSAAASQIQFIIVWNTEEIMFH